MRVTNGMIRNNSLNSLYSNMNSLNKLYAQMSTGKKIQTVSDDPIIAGRALKLKVTVLESQQYQGNAKEATSWTEITESALDNMTSILKGIRDKCLQAATSTSNDEAKNVLKTEINELWSQLQQEANVSYGGRYVFTGYKTNEPLMLTEKTTLDKETTLGIDLAITGDTTVVAGSELTAGTTLSAGTKLSAADATALGFTVPAGDTEYVLDADFNIPTNITLNDNANVVNGSKLAKDTKLAEGTILPGGTLNPKVNGKIDGQNMQYEVGVGNTITINTLGMDGIFGEISNTINSLIDSVNDSMNGTVTGTDLNDMYDQKIGEIDAILTSVSEKTTELGSRVARLEYVEDRLTDDVTNFKDLLSQTEDIDVEEVYVNFNSQYSVYLSALQATSKVIMNTLADYL